jgi:hydroxypyruvate reductase
MDLNRLRQDASAIFFAGLRAAEPGDAVRRHIALDGDKLIAGEKPYDLSTLQGIYLVGMGKAAAAMAQPIQELMGPRIRAGALTVKYGHSKPLLPIRVTEAGHPVPDEAGVQGAREIISILNGTGADDLVICLVSGGGSALSPAPVEGLSLQDMQEVTRRLLECGASIHEINPIRKHLSRIKGGHLARLATPSALLALLLSDVIGDDLDIIASGPTAPDRSTYTDCLEILDRYGIRDAIPGAALRILLEGHSGLLQETPKEGDPVFRRTQNLVVGSNALAVQSARAKAEELGYHPLVLSTFVEGETREVARVHAAIAREILASGNPVPRPACVISGGETTVTLRGQGMGGRNQEFALASALAVDGLEGVVILSAGTDGTDGPTDAAGAVADGTTVARALDKGLEAQGYLRENDSYPFFDALGDLLRTGPTLTNVMDLRLVMVG